MKTTIDCSAFEATIGPEIDGLVQLELDDLAAQGASSEYLAEVRAAYLAMKGEKIQAAAAGARSVAALVDAARAECKAPLLGGMAIEPAIDPDDPFNVKEFVLVVSSVDGKAKAVVMLNAQGVPEVQSDFEQPGLSRDLSDLVDALTGKGGEAEPSEGEACAVVWEGSEKDRILSGEPNLSDYDVILINTSAGKDSQAMMHYVVDLAERAGVRDRVMAVHCDLGQVEWKGTPELAREQAEAYGMRFYKVLKNQGDLLWQIEFQRELFPGPKTRYCTSDQKRAQVERVMTQIVDELTGACSLVRASLPGEWYVKDGSKRLTLLVSRPGRSIWTKPIVKRGQPAPRAPRLKILNCLGLRAEESPGRAKTPAFRECHKSNLRRLIHHWLPIHDWSTAQVWDTIRASGVRHHWAYDIGMPRLSCCFCFYAPTAPLVIAGKHNRQLLEEYVRIEKAIGHTFKWGGDPAKVEAKILAVRNEITTNPKGLGGKQLDKLRVRLAKLEQQVEVVRERARKSSIAYILELVNAGEADRIVLTDEWGACA